MRHWGADQVQEGWDLSPATIVPGRLGHRGSSRASPLTSWDQIGGFREELYMVQAWSGTVEVVRVPPSCTCPTLAPMSLAGWEQVLEGRIHPLPLPLSLVDCNNPDRNSAGARQDLQGFPHAWVSQREWQQQVSPPAQCRLPVQTPGIPHCPEDSICRERLHGVPGSARNRSSGGRMRGMPSTANWIHYIQVA